jgi:hypothetical protein
MYPKDLLERLDQYCEDGATITMFKQYDVTTWIVDLTKTQPDIVLIKHISGAPRWSLLGLHDREVHLVKNKLMEYF